MSEKGFERSFSPLPPTESSNDQESERRSKFEVFDESFRPYSLTAEHIIDEIQKSDQMKQPRRGASDRRELSGEYDGRQWSVRLPHAKVTKHGFVGLVDIDEPSGTKFECVVKSLGSENMEVKSYLKISAEKPLVKKYVPTLYAREGGWTVVEKLKGLEGEESSELQDRLESDPDFLDRYVEKSYTMVKESAENELDLRDVSLGEGHNVLVNPDTADLRLIELDNFGIDRHHESNELIAEQLLVELEKTKANSPASVRYSFKMLQRAMKDIDADQFYIRPIAVGVKHSRYRELYNNRQKLMFLFDDANLLSEELYKKVAANPVNKDNYITYGSREETESIAPELIAAVQQDDLEEFKRMVEARQLKSKITDKEDPRAAPKILDDTETL